MSLGERACPDRLLAEGLLDVRLLSVWELYDRGTVYLRATVPCFSAGPITGWKRAS